MAALAEHILQPGLHDAQVLGMLPSGEPKAVYLFLVASMDHSRLPTAIFRFGMVITCVPHPIHPRTPRRLLILLVHAILARFS